MEIIDNINRLLGDDLKQTIKPGAKLKIAAACFSIYAYEALKHEFEQIESLEFIFTLPTFVPSAVTDAAKKERREFHIPKAGRERGLYGGELEVKLKNKLTQRAIAKECAAWMRRKATFRSNRGVATVTARKAQYIRTPRQDDVFYCELVSDYLAQFGSASRKEINELFREKLSEGLNPTQREYKSDNLLRSIRKAGMIQILGARKSSRWSLNVEKSGENAGSNA